MNKNNINFQVHRTKEGTICEIISGVLILISLALSLVLINKSHEAGSAMLIQTVVLGLCNALILFLAYRPETFNIPDNSPAEMFVATIRFCRLSAILLSLMSVTITVNAFLEGDPRLIFGILGFLFIPLLCWYFTVYIRTKYRTKK
ncbi:MAG: hypothetical protein IJ588_05780 [Prevotella sp.]|nr:hypothetical protein [Prevotella sp.]